MGGESEVVVPFNKDFVLQEDYYNFVMIVTFGSWVLFDSLAVIDGGKVSTSPHSPPPPPLGQPESRGVGRVRPSESLVILSVHWVCFA